MLSFLNSDTHRLSIFGLVTEVVKGIHTVVFPKTQEAFALRRENAIFLLLLAAEMRPE